MADLFRLHYFLMQSSKSFVFCSSFADFVVLRFKEGDQRSEFIHVSKRITEKKMRPYKDVAFAGVAFEGRIAQLV